MTKLYLAGLFGSYSKSENPYLTRQARSFTGQVRSGVPPDKSDALGIYIPWPFSSPHLDSFSSPLSSYWRLSDSLVIWGSPSLCLAIPRGFHPLSSSNPVSTGFAPIWGISQVFFTWSMIPSKLWSALRFPSVHRLLACPRLSRNTLFNFPWLNLA
jgi:hypothetical protein